MELRRIAPPALWAGWLVVGLPIASPAATDATSSGETPAAQAVSSARPSVLLLGGFGSYAMRSLNRSLGHARVDRMATASSVAMGASGGIELDAPLPHGWSVSYRYEVLPLGLTIRTPSGGSSFTGVAQSLTAGLSYPLLRYGRGTSLGGAGLGLIYFSGEDRYEAPGLSGWGFTFTAQGWVGHRRRLGRRGVVSMEVGLRYARFAPRWDGRRIFDARGDALELEYTGVMVRLGAGALLGAAPDRSGPPTGGTAP